MTDHIDKKNSELEDLSSFWKDPSWVLIGSQESDYVIYNTEDGLGAIIESNRLARAVIRVMLEKDCEVFPSIELATKASGKPRDILDF